MSREEIDAVMRKVKDWLAEEGMYKDKIVDDEATYHFIVEMPANSGRIAHIVQPKAREDLLIIGSGIKLLKGHYDGLKAMSESKRKELLWEMRFQLLFRDSDFHMEPSADDLKSIKFTRPIHFDGLNKNTLVDALREDFKCNLFIIWKMKQQFGEAPPSSAEQPAGYT